MVHVAERQFYDEVAARARSCQLIVAEGMPAKYTPAHEWMARHRWGHLVDQMAALHLETLGVPLRWESWPDDRPKSFREELMFHASDVAGAAVLGLTRQITDLMAVASVDQAEEYDQSALNLTGGKLDRLMEYRIKTARDAKLVHILGEIHHDRAAEPIKAGVVFGAAHMPAVAAYLCGQLGYIASSADWLIVARARSLLSPGWSWPGFGRSRRSGPDPDSHATALRTMFSRCRRLPGAARQPDGVQAVPATGCSAGRCRRPADRR
jgi:hypothetical protein